ncbi:shikimate kinase [Roseibacterium sp. SDUM158017]|uniref:shikimate kinase n=1 Tax=Roseicyclus salinarum TaxID=3036773 RepID=UPI002414D819|nr:shikimate kinase [Roseibacterium sp. SDUM158017]MDG4648401.1 shikimate kinase [Roseibacterium sp. SDUM158017]
MGESAPEVDVRLRKTVVLIGMMGAGKTAVGRALATRLGVPMRDSDAEIVDRARLSIAEIFERYGEAFFREKETQVIARLLEDAPCVLSTGGGAWMSERNRQLMTAKAAVLWLEADLELLWSRVRHKTTRPLLRTDNPRRSLSEILEARSPVYRLAPLKVHVQPEWSITETAGHVLRRLVEAGAVEELRSNE